MKTFSAKTQDVVKKWVVIDAADQALGRVASKVAAIVRGKTKPIYTPHVDTGDNVIIILQCRRSPGTARCKTRRPSHRVGRGDF